MYSSQLILNDLQDLLADKDLKTYEKMVLIVFKVYEHTHSSIFPDYETIAAAGGMSKRKAQYVVKELSTQGLIQKEHRYKKDTEGYYKQTSNLYQLSSTSTVPQNALDAQTEKNDAPHAPDSAVLYAPDASYSNKNLLKDLNSLKDLKDLEEEEEQMSPSYTIEPEPNPYPKYEKVYHQMIIEQQTGSLNYLQKEFLEQCSTNDLPNVLVESIYQQVEKEISCYRFEAIERAITKLVKAIRTRQVKNPINWFSSVYKNEDLLVRTEQELHQQSS